MREYEGKESSPRGPEFELTPPDFSHQPQRESIESQALVPQTPEALPTVSTEVPAQGRRARNAARKAGHVLGQVAQDHIDTSRQNIATAPARAQSPVWRATKYAATWAIEMIPLGLGPWGIGDLVTALEGFAGRTIDGKKLSTFERIVIYGGASLIPVVPARPLVTAYEIFHKKRVEPHLRQK